MRALKLPGIDYWKVALHEFSINPDIKVIPTNLDLINSPDYLNTIERHIVYDSGAGQQHKVTEAFYQELKKSNRNSYIGMTFELITKEASVPLPYIFEAGMYIYGYVFHVNASSDNTSFYVEDYICVPSQMECDLINIMNV